MLYSYIGPYVNSSLWQQTLKVQATSLLIDWLIDWYLTPTLAVFQLYRGVNNFYDMFNTNRKQIL